MVARPRIAVVSPFLDKRHGTERCVAEQVERLADDYEFHVYSTRVEDVDLSKILWHRIPNIPGPHLLRYLWWFIANQLWRWWDRRVRKLEYDLVYSPGINCLDADVISIHIVFAEFYRQIQPELSLRRNPWRFWPRLIHRRLYYGLIIWLEQRVYSRRETSLVLIARKSAKDLKRFYDRTDSFPVVYHGVDHQTFNPEVRKRLREPARKQLHLDEDAFALLLVGNDWKKNGLPSLLEALGRLKEPQIRLLVVGQDDPRPYAKQIQGHVLEGKVCFLPPRPDVAWYYAAADAYVGPSLEDAFGLPPAEAMACGLPVVVSQRAGVSEVMTDSADGIILQDPTDAEDLAGKIRGLYEEAELCRRLGENAAQTARRYSWERNAVEIRAVLEEALRTKKSAGQAHREAVESVRSMGALR